MGMLTENLWPGQDSGECSSFRAQYAMANDNRPKKDRASETARKDPVKTSAERPFDMWLQKQLHAMYDEIAAEPLPDDLLGLIERDARKKDTSGDKE